MKTTKRSMWMAGLSLLLCIAMLAGTTFAWFSDSISNKDNRIQAGALDIELYKATDVAGKTLADDGWTEVKDNDDPILSGDVSETLLNWQPGEYITVYLAVKNNGNLALKYNLDLVINADTMSQALLIAFASSKETVPVVEETAAITPVSSTILTSSGANVIPTAPNGELGKGEVEYITIVIKFDPSVGNFYQDGIFDFDVILTATQTIADDIVKAYSASDINSAGVNATVVLMKDINEPNAEITISQCINLDLNGYTLTVKSITIDVETHAGIMEIADGIIEIIDSMTINLPLGTVNQTNVTIVAAEGSVTINVADHSYNLLNGSKIIANTLELQGKTRLAMDIGTQLQADTIIFEVPEPDTGEEPGDPTPPPKPKIEQAPGSSITNQAGGVPDIKDTNDTPINANDFIKEVDGNAGDGIIIPAGFNVVVNNIDELETALKNAKDGDKIFLMPGYYPIADSLVIEASITLYGPNYDKTGNDFTRKNEATLCPKEENASLPTRPLLYVLSASDVSIIGIQFVGKTLGSNNNYDWGAAILAYVNSAGNKKAVSNLLIRNNKFSSFYGQAITTNAYEAIDKQTKTNKIIDNHFVNIGTANGYTQGIAVVISRGAYTDVINNVIDGAYRGIVLSYNNDEYLEEKPVVSGNIISAIKFGIQYRNNNGTAKGYIIENNNITYYNNDNGDKGISGILVSSNEHVEQIIIKNNYINGFIDGICVWDSNVPDLELIGGTIENCTNAIGMISNHANYGLGTNNPNQYLTVSTLPTIINCTNKFLIDNTINGVFTLNVTDPAFNVNDVVVNITGTGKVYINSSEQIVVTIDENNKVYRNGVQATSLPTIFSAAATGSRIIMHEGTYISDSVVVIHNKALDVLGVGTVVISKSETGDISDSNRQVFTVTGRDLGASATIENLILDANNRNDKKNRTTAPLNIISADVIIKNVTLRNANGEPLFVNATYLHDTNVTAYGLKVENCVRRIDVTGGVYKATFNYEIATCNLNGNPVAFVNAVVNPF